MDWLTKELILVEKQVFLDAETEKPFSNLQNKIFLMQVFVG
jgi:hypothetical protein